MKRTVRIVVPIAACMAAPALAEDPKPQEQAVVESVETFLAAQRAGNWTRMRQFMLPNARLSVRRIGRVKGKRAEVIDVNEYIRRVATFDDRIDERMTYTTVEIDGNTARVTGPFNFTVDGKTTHCGINSLGMVKSGVQWKLGDSSYEIVPPSECAAVGAPQFPR